jgi:hypothetical protein
MLPPFDPTQGFAGQLERIGCIDVSDQFCDARHSPPFIGNVMLCTDDNPLTVAIARTRGPLLPTRNRTRGTFAAYSAASAR